MKQLLVGSVVVLLIAGSCAAWNLCSSHTLIKNVSVVTDTTNSGILRERLLGKAIDAKRYCKTHGYNTSICFLVDMSIESGKNRFFIYDMQSELVLKQGLVTHGSCNKNWLTEKQFGNVPGCGCTSLGKYKIGQSYMGRFGMAYKLYGLDTSNSKAFNRFIVLHSMQCIPENEVYPYPICQSEGCPAVSASFLRTITTVLKPGRPVLLWIFDGE